MNWWLVVIHFLHSLQMALTASGFICLMMSTLHPSASVALFSFAFFLTDHLKSAEMKGAWDEESLCILCNESGIIGGSSCGWSFCSFWMCSFAFRTPSEVRALTDAPNSPALVSASALFVGLKEPCLRTTLGMFHSSLTIPFLNNPMSWRTLLTAVLPLMLLLGRMSLGRTNRPQEHPSSLSSQVKLGLSQG